MVPFSSCYVILPRRYHEYSLIGTVTAWKPDAGTHVGQLAKSVQRGALPASQTVCRGVKPIDAHQKRELETGSESRPSRRSDHTARAGVSPCKFYKMFIPTSFIIKKICVIRP